MYKKWLFFTFAVFVTSGVNAQNYLISFAGTGASTTVSTVKVENLLKGTTLTLYGRDILRLTGTEENSLLRNRQNEIKIYPNPVSKDNTILQIHPPYSGNAFIRLYDLSGKIIAQIQTYLWDYTQEFRLSGMRNGYYIISVKGNNYQYSRKLVCNGNADGQIKIVKISYDNPPGENKPINKYSGIKDTVDMLYSAGDRLKFTGTSENYSTIVMDVPSGDKTITFPFIACSDGDNNNYQIVEIGSQIWMAENLKTTRYNDGSAITYSGKNDYNWNNQTAEAYAWYDYDEAANKDIYGALYNWRAVNTGILCPSGWHVPKKYEWMGLREYLGGTSVAGGKMKNTGTAFWDSPNNQSTNESGFSALPGGMQNTFDFSDIKLSGYWWSSTFYRNWGRPSGWYLNSDSEVLDEIITYSVNKGFSVRCLLGQSGITIPFVLTHEIKNISTNAATGGGMVISDEGADIIDLGVCWNTSKNPTIENEKTSNGPGKDIFTSNITGLRPGTTYHTRAFATNIAGTAYGDDITFTTEIALPVLTTSPATHITQTSATSGGNITDDGGGTITERGVCWSTTASPTLTDAISVNGTGTGSFTADITVLRPGTTYHIRAYATNSAGTAFGDELTFTTAVALPLLSTLAVINIAQTTATSSGNIADDGGGTISERGVCWSTTASPTISNNRTLNGTGTGSFAGNITGLRPGTTYHVRAYATNSAGTAYGDNLTFTTMVALPVLSTLGVTSIRQTTATSGGNITDDGGGSITARGVCWATTTSPTINDNRTSNGTGTGSFTVKITGLQPETTYYVRAYATNSAGTAYGNELVFTTLTELPVLTTSAVTNITTTSATSGGNVTDDGGRTITERGVCWATTASPTITDNRTSNGTGTGSFTAEITVLRPGTTYHIRAYATNSAGTAFSDELTFTTAVALPLLSTLAVINIAQTTATSGGNIADDGGGTITERGVCWATTSSPTIVDNRTSNGTGTGSFAGNITGLRPGTTYHVRAYATNSAGTAYGDDLTFTTEVALPALSTSTVTNIAQTTATSGGNISGDGGGSITERGICWATTASPAISDNRTSNGTGTGSFTGNITGLQPGITYHVRAYATNSAGTAYGNELDFTTMTELPVLTTSAVTNITSNAATSGGNVTYDGGRTITERGVCWATTASPDITDNRTSNGTGTGSFTINITGLLPGTTYHVRAYATNGAGTSYGNELDFTTLTELPVLSTSAFTSITQTTATSGGNISDDGGGSITARGVCWATTASPTISNNRTSNGTGTGSFTANITGLLPGTIYHLRAYATNSAGTAYGDDLTFTTEVALPALSTSTITNITQTSATSGGNISGDGGGSITERGVCWATTASPTISDNRTSNGTGTGSFTDNISELLPGTTYHVRAYATNSAGTAYGNELDFTTLTELPVLTTSAVTNITQTTASSGGNITDDGGRTITDRGICWATTASPTITDTKSSNGNGTGSFTVNITGLQPGTSYYVRAYATNSAGTAYGNQVSFSTNPETPPVVNFISPNNEKLLHSVGDKKIIFKTIGADDYIKFSGDNGVSYNQGVKVTGIFKTNNKARILGNGNIALFCTNKIYYSDNNMVTITPCNVLNKDGSPYSYHTPANPAYPGGYFNFMGGFAENAGVCLLGNYTNSSEGASPVNLYYSLDGITWKVIYTFGQSPSHTDNGTSAGGVGGTLLGDPNNSIMTRHIHAVNIGEDGNFYICTGDVNQEMHFLKCSYNSSADTWNINDLLTGERRNWQRMRALGVYERNGYLYWGSDGPGTFNYGGVTYDCEGIYKCAVSAINDPSKHILLQPLEDVCYSFLNVNHLVFAGLQNDGYVYISFDYGETWLAYAKPSWMTEEVEGVWFNELRKFFATHTGVIITSDSF